MIMDKEKNKELRDLKTHVSLLQNIQDNTDILCKLGAVIIAVSYTHLTLPTILRV